MCDLGPVPPDLLTDTPIDLAALILIIEREICVFLKDSDLAHPFGADAAGGHIRNATIFKVKPRVSDIFAVAEHGYTDRVDTPKRRTHEMQNNFKSMNN